MVMMSLPGVLMSKVVLAVFMSFWIGQGDVVGAAWFVGLPAGGEKAVPEEGSLSELKKKIAATITATRGIAATAA